MKPFRMVVLTLALCYCVDAYNDQQCTVSRFGSCQYTSTPCRGSYVRNLCGGPYSRRCCIPAFNDARCSGTCQSTSVPCAGGSYVRGLCGGPSSRRCCVTGSGGLTGSRPSTGCGSCSDVTIVTRSQWGAAAPRSTSRMSTPVSLVFIHHTDGAACSDLASCARVARGVQNYHMNDPTRRYSDVGYNFLVGGDGKIYEGRGWDRVGAHTLNYNSRAVAISFMGKFQRASPTSQALCAAKSLLDCGVRQGKISRAYTLHGHRQARGASTDCPGDTLYNIIQQWSHYSAGRP